MLCYQKKNPKFARARNNTTDWPLAHQSMVFWFKKKGQLVPNIGKHRAKQELETVPPQELGTVPPQGAKKGLWGGTVSNYPVGLFLTLDLLLAAVRRIFFLCGTVPDSWSGQKVVPKPTLRHMYIYICCRKGIWSHFAFLEGGFGPRGASRSPFERFRACFLGVSCWRSGKLK